MVSCSAAALPRNSLAKVADPIGCPRCLQPVVISCVHLPDKVVTTEQKELLEWQHITKPNFSDFPILKEGTNIAQYLEKLDATSEMHQMEETLDVNHKPKNRELHKRKSQWTSLGSKLYRP